MTQNNNLWSCNEWDPLKEIIIGTAQGANIPHGDLSHHATNYANLSHEEYAKMPKVSTQSMFTAKQKRT